MTKWLKSSGTVRDCEVGFVVLSSFGLLCIVSLYVACLLQESAAKLFLAAIAYGVPGAILAFFGASLYFARWLSLSGGEGTTKSAK